MPKRTLWHEHLALASEKFGAHLRNYQRVPWTGDQNVKRAYSEFGYAMPPPPY